MTTSYERYRAITMAEQLLKEIESGAYTDLDELKYQAKTVLRHYPSQSELKMIAQVNNQNPIIGCMLSDENTTMTNATHPVVDTVHKKVNQNLKLYVHEEDQESLKDYEN